MRVVAVVQARMGSTRLPGKMMLPIGGTEAIRRVVRRVRRAEEIDEVVVATTTQRRDDLIAEEARREDSTVYRGDASDVLGRTVGAAETAGADVVVRVTGDCVFASPEVLDTVVGTLNRGDHEYVSNNLTRSFPLGLDAEAFTIESLREVDRHSTAPNEREHVTVYYKENTDEFDTKVVTSSDVFDQQAYRGRTDIEFVLDEPADYRFLDRVFSELNEAEPGVRAAIDYVDENEMSESTGEVTRKTVEDVEDEVV